MSQLILIDANEIKKKSEGAASEFSGLLTSTILVISRTHPPSKIPTSKNMSANPKAQGWAGYHGFVKER